MRRRLKSQLDVDTLAPLLILTGLLASCGPAVTPEPAGGRLPNRAFAGAAFRWAGSAATPAGPGGILRHRCR